jgi:hypothetical protein
MKFLSSDLKPSSIQLPPKTKERERDDGASYTCHYPDSSLSHPPQNLFPSVYLVTNHSQTVGSASITNHESQGDCDKVDCDYAILRGTATIQPHLVWIFSPNSTLATAVSSQWRSIRFIKRGGHSRVNAIRRQRNCAIWKDIAILHQHFKALSISNIHRRIIIQSEPTKWHLVRLFNPNQLQDQ